MLTSPPIRTLVSPGSREGSTEGSAVGDGVTDGTGVGNGVPDGAGVNDAEASGEVDALADAEVPGVAVPVTFAVQPARSPQTRTVRR